MKTCCNRTDVRCRAHRYDRSRQARWDRRNLRTVSTHLTVQEAEDLKELCAENGITPYYLLNKYLRAVLEVGLGAEVSAPSVKAR